MARTVSASSSSTTSMLTGTATRALPGNVPTQERTKPPPSPAEDSPDIYSPNPALGSVVSYPSRCRVWGDASYRGNCDGTLFKELVLRYRPRRVADPMMGSGTTRDVITGLNRHAGTNIEYWGADLRAGFDLERDPLPGPFDFVWVHPPYWDIVRYSNNPRDLSATEGWSEFALRLSGCLLRCVAALAPGGHLAVLVGDIRKRGAYYSMQSELLRHRGAFGELRSILIKVQHNCTSDGRDYRWGNTIPIRHEYCLVFEKEL